MAARGNKMIDFASCILVCLQGCEVSELTRRGLEALARLGEQSISVCLVINLCLLSLCKSVVSTGLRYT